MKTVTVKDVAKEAGVSVGTVSRYLNGQILKEANMISVKKAISKLGYKENLIAKGMKNHITKSVGVVINTLTDIFATSIVAALESVLEEENYSLIICDYQQSQKNLERKLEFLKNRNVDAVVLFHVEKDLPILREFREDNIPILSIDCPTIGSANDVLVIDNANISYDMLQLLHSKGHRRVGIIAGDQERYTGRERFSGCVQFYKDYEMDIDKDLFCFGNYQKQDGYVAMNTLLSLPHLPTAVYATNYYMTMGAIQAIYEHQLTIPNDISIVGFDYIDIFDVFNQKITMVEQPLAEIGEKAAMLILERLRKNTGNTLPCTTYVSASLHLGESIKTIHKVK